MCVHIVHNTYASVSNVKVQFIEPLISTLLYIVLYNNHIKTIKVQNA